MVLDHKELLKVVNGKNKDSWHILFDHYYQALCSYVLKFLKDRDISEDIVQEVFIGLWNSSQRFENQKNLTYFLYKSCYNRSLNYIRDQKVKNSSVELIEDSKHFDSEEIYEETLQEEVVRLLYLHINNLPAQQKEILLLRLKGYKWNEIAEELDVSMNTVKTYRQRAFKKLSEKMNVSELFIAVLIVSIQMFSNK